MRIDLDVRRTLDLEAIERGRTMFTFRCFARLRFREPSGWSDERFAILDTGAPFSVIPATVWTPLTRRPLFPTHLRGIIPNVGASVPARLATVTGVITDERAVSPPLELIALLVDAPDVPLVLGWAGCLDRATLTLAAPRHQAWLEF